MANPLATILSFAMMLRYSFDLADDAALIERAVADLLDAGYCTADIMQPGADETSTSGMGEAVVAGLETLAG